MSVDANRAAGIAHFGSAAAFDAWQEEQIEGVKATAARLQREREQVEAAANNAAQARRDAANAAELETVKRRAQAAFPGTLAEFEKAWPAIRSQWQQRQAAAALDGFDAIVERKRASGMY